MRRAVLALLPLAVAGCSWLTPPATTSGIALPARLITADASQPAIWPDPAWWRGFGSAELNALMDAAMAQSFDLAAAEARVRQADAQARIAGATLLPTVNLTTQATRQQSTTLSSGGGTSISARSRRLSTDVLSLSGSYEIDFWGKNRSATEAAQQTAFATRFDRGTVMLTTQAGVANSWFAMLAAQEQLAIQQANLATAERVLGVLRQRVQVGTSTGLDAAQQETVAAQQRAQIPPLRQAIEQNRYALAVLVGQTPEAVRAAGGEFQRVSVPAVNAGMPAEVLVRRPDVLNAEATLAAANANIVVARAQLLPSITLTGSGGFQSTALETWLRPEAAVFNIAAGLVQPIFRGGALRAQVQVNEARAMELLALYRRAIVNALADTETALVALRETTEQERLAGLAVAAAERAYGIAEAQLRAGTIDVLTLLNTQQNLFTTRNLRVQARLARLQAAVALFRALGGGWGTPT